MDLRAIQKPLKGKYRSDPNSSLITLKAHGKQSDSPIACSVEVGQKLIDAQAHAGVGVAGTSACSGDLLLGALEIHTRFEIKAPEGTPEQLAALKEKTEQSCVVMQTLVKPPTISTRWV